MAEQISNSRILKNTFFSIGAQIISLLTSIIVNLIVPRYISELNYAYWQTYLLYASYVGILHFGILDGMVLRYSEFDYKDVNKSNISFHFWFLNLLLLIFTSIGIFSTYFLSSDLSKIQVVLISISILSKNLFMFSSYSYQMTNRIKSYAWLIIRQRLLYGVFAICLLLFKVDNFVFFCIADIIADLTGFIFSLWSNKEFYKLYKINSKHVSDLLKSLKSGLMLMIANFSSNFIVGSAKFAIQIIWSAIVFAQISFSFSITNLFLTFVMAISAVLFPSLKRMDKSRLPIFYSAIRGLLTPVLICALAFYFPGSYILKIWLPKYEDSLIYAGILLPLIISSTKVSLLTNNYLKAFREEKKMLIINIMSMFIELALLVFFSVLYKSLEGILISTVLVSLVRSVISEWLVSSHINVKYTFENIIEFLILISFIIITMNLNDSVGFIVYSGLLLLYLFITYNSIKKSLGNLRRRGN